MLGIGWIFGIIFWVLLICIVVGLVRWYVSSSNKNNSSDEEDASEKPIDILKRRYAKGEITKKEFLEMKNDIA
jgi:putative membrane protein